MKNKLKKVNSITAWIMALAVMLSLAVPMRVSASEMSQQQQIDYLTDQLNAKDRQIEDLQNRINNPPQSTPRPTATPVYEPLVKLLTPQTVEAKPGDSRDVVITLKNIGTSAAYNLLTQATPPDLISAVFVDNSNNADSISENGSRSMTMTIHVNSGVKPGTYSIKLDHYYKTKDLENRTSTDILTVYVGGSAVAAPNVTLSGFTSNKPSIMPGETVNITAAIDNLGDGEASQVQIAVTDLDTKNLILVSDLNLNYLSVMEAGQKGLATFSFRAADKAESNTYPINFKLSYRDGNNELKEVPYTYYVNIISTSSVVNRANVQISGLNAPPGLFEVGQNATVALHLVNSGAGPATGIKITATPSDTSALVPTSANIHTINTFAPGAEQVINFSFSPTEASKTQSYVVGFKVEYLTGAKTDADTDETLTFEQYASINVNNPEEEDDSENGKTSKPKIIVSEYTIDPTVVYASREFDLNITFQNSSSVKTVENIKVTLEALETTEKKGSVFTPVGGSNSVYIDSIGIKEEKPYKLRFYTVSDAEPRTYKMQVKFQYQDEDLNEYEEIEQLAINVQQTSRIEADDNLFFPETAMVGEEIYMYTSIINSGKVTASNMRIRIDVAEGSDFDVSQADTWVGNIGKGNSSGYDGIIKMTTPGTQSGTFVAYGEDDVGAPIVYEKEFTINVVDGGGGMDGGMMGRPGMAVGEDGMTVDDPGMMNPDEPQGFWGQAWAFVQKPYVWGTGIGVIVVIVIVVIGLVRRKKNKVDFDE